MASQHTYSTDSKSNVLPLRPVIKDYAWGIRGLDSRVARFALESGVIDEVDPGELLFRCMYTPFDFDIQTNSLCMLFNSFRYALCRVMDWYTSIRPDTFT